MPTPLGESGGILELISLDRTALEDFCTFLAQCDLIETLTFERVFAPEEELLGPYFTYLKLAFDLVIDDQRIKSQFKQAFDYYVEEDFKHCISSLGLIAEDYVAQIYATFVREPSPLELTLGQLYDQLHIRIREVFDGEKDEVASVDAVFAVAKALGDDKKSVDGAAIGEALRLLAKVIKQDRRIVDERFGKLKGNLRSVSVFPKRVRDHIDELIRNRNAASHKTRVPIGNYEAQKTLLGVVALIRWWKDCKSALAWNEPRDDVLRQAVARAK